VSTKVVLTPAEIFGAFLDAPVQDLVRLNALIKKVDFTYHPPFDLIAEVFTHCVEVHKQWTIELLTYHLGDYADRLSVYVALLEGARETDKEYVFEHLVHYQTTIWLDKFKTELVRANGNVSDVLKKFSRQLGSLAVSTTSKVEAVTASELLTSYGGSTDKSVGFSLPLNLGFDQQLGGGIRPGEILLFVGPTGAGKSTLLLHSCLESIRHGLTAVYVSLELSLDLVREKLVAHSSLRRLDTSHLEKLHLLKFPTKSVTLEEIFVFVDQWHAQVVAIDYLDILSFGGSDRLWQTLEDLTARFRGYCEERGIIGLTVSQANREGIANNKIVDINHVAFSLGKVFTADFVITLTPPDFTTADTTAAFLYLTKNRRGPKWLQPVRIDYEHVIVTPIQNVDYTLTRRREDV